MATVRHELDYFIRRDGEDAITCFVTQIVLDDLGTEVSRTNISVAVPARALAPDLAAVETKVLREATAALRGLSVTRRTQ